MNYCTKTGAFIILTCCLSACYQPKEGCLDLTSTTYDVSADEPCADCCEYPGLSLTVFHQVALPVDPDTFIGFKYNFPYPSPLDTSHLFEVSRSRFFITYLEFVREDGTSVGVEDTISLLLQNDSSVTVTNSFAKVDRDIFSANHLGTIRSEGVFTKLKFNLGLPENLLQVEPDSLPTSHPLNPKSDSLIYEEGFGYIPNLLIFSRDTFPDTMPITLKFQEKIEILLPLPQPFTIEPGFDIELAIRVNYLAWFAGIDLQNDSPETIRQKVIENMPSGFSVLSVLLKKA